MVQYFLESMKNYILALNPNKPICQMYEYKVEASKNLVKFLFCLIFWRLNLIYSKLLCSFILLLLLHSLLPFPLLLLSSLSYPSSSSFYSSPSSSSSPFPNFISSFNWINCLYFKTCTKEEIHYRDYLLKMLKLSYIPFSPIIPLSHICGSYWSTHKQH